MHGLKKIIKRGEKKGFRKTHLGILMFVHRISLGRAPSIMSIF